MKSTFGLFQHSFEYLHIFQMCNRVIRTKCMKVIKVIQKLKFNIAFDTLMINTQLQMKVVTELKARNWGLL